MAQHPDVVDVHTHVFNARYLPLKNILLSHLGDRTWYKERLAAAAAAIFEGATDSSYKTNVSTSSTSGNLSAIKKCVEAELEDRTRGFLVAAGQRDRAEYVLQRLVDDPLMTALLEADALREVSGDRTAGASEIDPTGRVDAAQIPILIAQRRATLRKRIQGLEEVGRAGVDGLFELVTRIVKWVLEKLWKLFRRLDGWWSTFKDFTDFLRRVLMSERDIYKALAKAYSQSQPVVHFVHHMMDMQYAYQPPESPKYPIADQRTRMLRLAEDAGGRLLGFVAFDPRRPGALASVRDAVSKKGGFLGVKFYPAMGYRPWANDDAAIQCAVTDLWRYCSDEDVPVFAHCTPLGFQARSGLGKNAHPKYWRMVLERFPQLRLCLGHAGGGAMTNGDLYSAGWYARSRDEWTHCDNFARVTVELCTSYERVYCEIGHLHELLGPRSWQAEAFRSNFSREWQEDVRAFPFHRKCMFGSDHHMPLMINRADDLLAHFAALFDDARLNGFADFCSGNAASYLELLTPKRKTASKTDGPVQGVVSSSRRPRSRPRS